MFPSRRNSYQYYLASLLGLVLFFLNLEFLKRFEYYFLPMPWYQVLTNVSVVLTAGCLWAAVAATCLWLMDAVWGRMIGLLRLPFDAGKAGRFILYFAFVSINLLSLKWKFATPLDNMSVGGRTTLTWSTLILVVTCYPRFGRRIIFEAWFHEQAARVNRAGLAICLGACLFPGASLTAQALAVPTPPAAGTLHSPHIILVTFDALGSRHMGLYGYPRRTTPNLDALGSESAVFERCHSNSNFTAFSLPNIQGYPYATTYPREMLSTQLEAAGYDTLLVSHFLPSLIGLPGLPHHVMLCTLARLPLVRSLDRHVSPDNLLWLDLLVTEELDYFNPYNPAVIVEYYSDFHRDHFPADVPLDYVEDYLSRATRPTFIWAHLWVPHHPYLPIAPFKGRLTSDKLPSGAEYTAIAGTQTASRARINDLRDFYDEYVMTGDSQFGDFLSHLKASGLYDRSILIVSSDHGESFTRYYGHGGPFADEEEVHIPLIIHLPGMHTGTRIQTFAQTSDLAPTLLSLLQLPVPAKMRGESLLPYMARPSALSGMPKFIITKTAYELGIGQVAVLKTRRKLIYNLQDPEHAALYDLFLDPDEDRDISRQHPDEVRELQGLFRFGASR